MVRGLNRGHIFADDQDRRGFLDKLAETTLAGKASIYAFALMDNHVHILIRSGDGGLSAVMRKALTWYAIYFNRRHNRTGHLFENRYKSILCEEDPYLLALVRYIHLNPVRAGIVTDIESLDRYPWSGHRMLIGNDRPPWLGTDFILGQFAATRKKAVTSYRRFVEEGITMGHRPELVGGGLSRSLSGWSQVVSVRGKDTQKGDERVLGSSEFVLAVLTEAEDRQRRQLKVRTPTKSINQIIEEECAERRVPQEELKNGGRRAKVSAARGSIAYRAVTEIGLSAAEAARHLGVTTSTVTRAVERFEKGIT
jgi:REP element-mobilizing transposase RayT